MIKKLTGQIPTVVIAAATAAIFGGTGAYAAAQITSAQIKDQTIQSRDIAAEGVGTSEVRNQSIVSGDIAEGGVGPSEIRNNSITTNDINDKTEAALKGAKGDKGADGKDGVVQPVYADSGDRRQVKDVGGSFGKFTGVVRATQVDTVELPAGDYVLTAEGFFINNAATSGKTRMQLAVRVNDGTDWGKDFGTCFTGAISTLAERESHCSSTRVVTVEEGDVVEVYAFGYADDQGAADSGKVDVSGDHITLTLTAPDGYLISGYCVKAGSANQGLGPEYYSLDPPVASVVISHSTGKAISHYSYTVAQDEEEECPPEDTTGCADVSGE